MPELPDRVPGEPIVASFSNQLIRRSVQRYADASQRQALNPLPEVGDVSYLTLSGVVDVFDGTNWVRYPDVTVTDALDSRLTLVEGLAASTYEPNPITLDADWTTVSSLTVPAAGDWIVTLQAMVEYELTIQLSSEPINVQITVDGLLEPGQKFGSVVLGTHTYPLVYTMPLPNLAADADIEFKMQASQAGIEDAAAMDRWSYAQRVTPGIIPEVTLAS